jgi:hypothetical protein
MMMRFTMATAAVLLGCGSAYAQARLNVSPLPALGMTSPLGIPNAPVGHTGIPMGATELATPGVSPTCPSRKSYPHIAMVQSGKNGVVVIAPHLWIARRNGAPFSNAKCARDWL